MSKKVGDLRIRASVDIEGDYYVQVEVYRGFWTGWKKVKRYFAMHGRTPEDVMKMATNYVNRVRTLPLGVIA